MAEMIPFHYVEFYDVPRTIALTHRGKLYLLQSAFDENLDDYPDAYTVYKLPEAVRSQIEGAHWTFLESLPLEPVGHIAIRNVRFDATKRRELDASILDVIDSR
jgi:hypothetical protein